MKLLYLEDDPLDVELLQLACAQLMPECSITAVTDRGSFLKALEDSSYGGILSDSGIFDLAGPDAVKLARMLAPTLPYVFYCGTMSEAKRADLLAAEPDGMFSKDEPADLALALALLKQLSGGR